MDVVYLAEQGSARFEQDRLAVDVVCAGDSITGWNNFGPVLSWPYRTYPDFLQKLCDPLGLLVANGGIAAEVSEERDGRRTVSFRLPAFPPEPAR